MKYDELKGTGVALVTPFNIDGNIDFGALEKVVGHVVAGGADYLVAMGTTGESATLSKKEKHEAIACIVQVNNNRLPVVLGIGSYNTREVIETITDTDLNPFAAVLSVSPYYNKPTQQGIYEHYKAIAQSCPKPIILYNVPGRTGRNISADTTLRLARDFSNIFAVKEASGDLNQIMQVIKNRPSGFMVISGDDALTYPLIAVGGDGVISVVANAFPADFSKMVKLALENKKNEALELHYKLLDIIGMLFEESSPAGIKAALHCMGLIKNVSRLPITPVSQPLYERIQNEINNLK